MKSSIDPDTLLMLQKQDKDNSFSARNRPNDIAEYCDLIEKPDFDADEIPEHLKFAFAALGNNDKYDPHVLGDELRRISTARNGACRAGPALRWPQIISTRSFVVIIICTLAIVIAFMLIARFGVLSASSPGSSNRRYAATRR